ncbi:MAG: maleylpyruvate isomerase family mycothiol-dependent enzyme [bacterium]
MTPDEYLSRVALVRSETERVSKAWRGLSEEQWKSPTFCPGWAAENAVSHVITGARFYINSIGRGLDGLPPEPPYGKDPKGFQTIRKKRGEELMALPRGEMMDAFDASAAELQKALERIGPDDLGKVGYHPRGLTRMDAWIGLRLVELVIHDWDIRSGPEPGSRVAPQGVEGMLTFIPANQARFFGVREKPPFEGRFRFRSTGPEREWSLTVAGEKAAESADVSGAFDVTISADGEAQLLLIFGRAKREEMEEAGRLAVEGDRGLADKLLDVLFTKY